MEQGAEALLAVILWAGQGQVSEAAEVGIRRVEEVVETGGPLEIAAALLGPSPIAQLGHPAVVAQLHGGHRYRLEAMDVVEEFMAAPVLGDQALDAGHITGRQIDIGLHLAVPLRGAKRQSGHPGLGLPGCRWDLLVMDGRDAVAQMQAGTALLDVAEDRTGEPAVGGALEQVELGGFGLGSEHHEDRQHAAR